MGKFSGIMLCSDLDGTLLNSEHTVSERNIKAIEYFKEQGGIFSIVTGRVPVTAKDIFYKINPNAPIGCINGGGVYDFAIQKYLWLTTLPKKSVEIIRWVDENLPQMGIQICTDGGHYFVKDNSAMQFFRKVTGVPYLECDYNNPLGVVLKVLFCTLDREYMQRAIKEITALESAQEYDFITSEYYIFELLPKGNNKGIGMEKIAEICGIDMSKTIAVGDYENDISMISKAKIGCAVGNALEQVKQAADYITVTNNEDAIAQIIEDLDKGKIVL